MIMKIAIPTHDGLNITPIFEHAKGTLVISVEFGEIIREEMRWNKLVDILNSPDGFLCNVSDCDTVLVNHISERCNKILTLKGKEVYTVNETIITSAFLHYMKERADQKSNYCCAP
jgi:predicted Fe-Mo cluster-binding NifX family protein